MTAASGQWGSGGDTALLVWLLPAHSEQPGAVGSPRGAGRFPVDGLQVRPPRRPCSVPTPSPDTWDPLEHAPGVHIALWPET